MLIPLPKPHVKEEIRASVMRLLESLMDDARAGKVDVVVIVAHYTEDNPWRNMASETAMLGETIGQLEILKHRWLKDIT